MKIITVSKKDLDRKNHYKKKEIIGKCSVIIKEGLGQVVFSRLSVKGYISARAGSGVFVGDTLKAGKGIQSDLSIESGGSIQAGGNIRTNRNLKAGGSILVDSSITAVHGITAKWFIQASLDILSNGDIKAGGSIITHYSGIHARTISCLRMTAGFFSQKKQIISGRLLDGEILGDFKEE